MTTIVATRTALYADSQATDYVSFKTSKLAHVQCKKTGEEFLLGGCGYLEDIYFAANLLSEYGLKDIWKLHLTDHWPPKIMKEFDSELMLVTREKKIYCFNKALVPMPINQDWHAMGSGGPFAISALAMGKTAPEAVEFAIQFDPYTKGPVHELKFPRRKKETTE